MPETIYSLINAFFLEIDAVDYRIKEPVLWNKVESSIVRNDKHGFDINFPSKDSVLEFAATPEATTGNKSKSLIDAEYAVSGADAEIILKFGTLDSLAVFTEISRGKVDLSKGYKNGLYKSKASVTNIPAKQRLLDYEEAIVKMNQSIDIQGNTLPDSGTPAQGAILNLHSQILVKRVEQKQVEEVLLTGGVEFDSNLWTFPITNFYLQYGFPDTIVSDGIEDFNLESFITEFSPKASFKANYKLLEASELLSIERFLNGVVINIVASVAWTIDTYLSIGTVQPDDSVTYVDTLIQSDSGNSNTIIQDTASLDAISVEYLRKGQFVLFYSHISTGAAVGVVNSISFGDTLTTVPELNPNPKRYNQQVKFKLDTIGMPTRNKAYKLKDAVEFCIRCIQNEKDLFKSDTFMGAGGNGDDMYVVGGYSLRNIPDIDTPGINSDTITKSPQLSLKSSFESCNMMFALGQNIETDGNGKQIVVWEELEHFYQNHEIINLTGKTSDFVIEPNKDLNVNLINLSYPNVSVRETSGAGSIDAVNTNIQASLPLVNGQTKYTRKSKWRTEGYDIETARRTSKLDKESVQTDEDNFLINTTDADTFNWSASFLAAGKTIEFPQAAYDDLKLYKRLTITGTVSNNITVNYDITEVIKTGITIIITVDEILTDEPNVFTTFTPSAIRSRQNDGFDTSEFVEVDIDNEEVTIDKPDLYNMILQPIRVLMQHTKWLNAAVWYKDQLASRIINAKTVFTNRYFTLKHSNAANFRTKLNVGETVVFGDTQKVELQPIKDFTSDVPSFPEENGFPIKEGYDGKSIVRPEVYKFKAVLELAEYNTIKTAANGGGLTPYGYISTINNDGDPVSGYPNKIEGQLNTNFYDLELLPKGDFYD